ncbi:MAG TPA: SusC/RagA family TonB-linked outer membrane protein, partial [Chryseolinea sp.]|nr:SusC/RagA family TonB-linked outer membrane protein [Chryseolinea sp.]
AYRALPVIPVYLPDGSYSPVPNVGNPLADIEYTNSYGSGLRTVGNMYGEADFLNAFTFKSSFGIDMVNNKGKSFTPVFFVSPQQQNSLSTLNKDWGERLSWLWENTLNYTKESGKHRINALAGYTMQEATSENVALQGRNITRDSEDFWYINSNNLYPYATDINSVDANQNYSIESILFRANYTYDNRFLFTATFRRDGSSKFAKDNRYGNFPSFAAGWNVINESFMQGISFLSNLKVRGSWGIIGNEKINYLRRYSVVDNNVNAVFGAAEGIVPGLTYGVTGNSNLKWESTYQTDIGLETGFLNDKLTLEIDYYNRTTKDILIDLSVPGYLGNGPGAQITYNAGEVLNRGFEFTLGWRDDLSKDFHYSINANATTIYNETIQVNGLGGSSDRLQGFGSNGQVTNTTPGVPIGSFYGYKVIGVFQNAAELAAYPHLSQAEVGDLKFEDTTPDGVLNAADRVNLGSPIPKLLYGFNLSASYKSFEISVDFNGVSGNKIYNDKETVRPDQYNYEKHVLNRWTGEGTSNSEPKASTGGYNYTVSSKFIQDGSYFRMRNVTIAYNLPASVVEKAKMKSARFYVGGTNLFTLTKFTGYTPEVASSSPILNGIDRGTYPLPAVYSVGLNVTF